ncbi:MAG: substrate-binding domain-containing protein [Lachnospiraceae bacterium]
MKKTLAIALALVCCLGLLAACGEPASDPSEAPASEAPASEAPASEAPSSEPIELSGTIVVNGSTSMGDVINALTEGFNELHPDVQISYTGSGSSAGIEAALAGSCDLGLSSRELSDDELSQGAVANVIAKDGVAVVVNPENPVTELTSEQIAKIFTGEITNWSELGGEDAEIAVFGRDSRLRHPQRLRGDPRHRGPVRLPQRVLLHRRRHRQCRLEPQRHRLCLPLRCR